MSDQEDDPASLSQCGSISENEPEVTVSATLVSDAPTSTGRRSKSKNPTRRTKVFIIKEADLVFGTFIRKSLDALDMVGYSRAGAASIVPFIYHHKGRTPKNAASVASEDDFRVLKRTIHARNLTAVNVEFQASDLAVKGITPKDSANAGDGGLAASDGVPRADSMTSLEVQRAKIGGLLRERWKCDTRSHTHCYKDEKGVHHRLTPHMFTTWTSFIVDHVATINDPPKLELFDFAHHQQEIDDRSPKTLLKPNPNAAQALVTGFCQLFGVSPSSTLLDSFNASNTSDHTPSPRATPTTVTDTPNTTPNVLTAFLKYARVEYGVDDEGYYQALAHNKIGPDVMGEVEVATLEGYGVPQGDALRLKRAARSWEEDDMSARPFKVPRGTTNDPDTPTPTTPTQSRSFTIAFDERASPLPPGYERTDLERAGVPRPGKKGNFCWQQLYPGEPGGYTFWANLPSPTLAPSDPLLAPMGTVQLRVAPGTFIDVVRAPRLDNVQAAEDDSLDLLDHI